MVIEELVIRLVAEGIAQTKAELAQQIKDAHDAQKKLDSMTDKAEAKRQSDAAKALRQQEQAAAKALKLQEQTARKAEAIRAKQQAAMRAGFGDFFGALQKIDGLIGRIAMTAAAGLTLGFGSAVAAVRSFTKEATQLESIAHFTSMTTQEFQALAYAGEQSGISAEKLADGFRQFNAGFRESVKAGGKGAVAEMIRDFGLSFKELQHQDPKAVFYAIMGAAEKLGPSMHRAGAMAKGFGEIAGANLARAADLGVDRLKALEQEAHDLGIVMSDEAVEAGIKLDQSFRRLSATFTGVRNQLGAELAPVILEVSDKIKDWVLENRRLIASRFKEWLSESITLGRQFVQWLKEVWPQLEKAAKFTATWAKELVITAAAIKGLLVAKEVVSVIVGLGGAFTGAKTGALALAGVLGPGGAVFVVLMALLPVALKVGEALGDIGSEESAGRVSLQDRIVKSRRPGSAAMAGTEQFIAEINALSKAEVALLRAKTIAQAQGSDNPSTLGVHELFNRADRERSARDEDKAARDAIRDGILAANSKVKAKDLPGLVSAGYISEADADLVRGRLNVNPFLRERQKDKKDKQVTDEELAKLIASAAKSGANLEDVLKGRKIAGGVPPVITVRIISVKIDAPITVTGKQGQSTGQLAQDVRIEFRTMLERELQKASTELGEAR